MTKGAVKFLQLICTFSGPWGRICLFIFDYTLTGMNYNVLFQMYLLLDHYQEERDKKRKAMEDERRLIKKIVLFPLALCFSDAGLITL